MSRRAVREIGTVKTRRLGKYASEKSREMDAESLLGILIVLFDSEEEEELKDEYFILIALLGQELEDIQRDVRVISEPIERKYLRFLTASLQDSFASLFCFRQECMTRLLYCLQLPAEFQLDNGSWSMLKKDY